jgi:hypothetical protein
MRSLCCRSRRWLGLAGAALALIGSAGCGAKTQPVQGKVVFKDRTPLTGGLVLFEPAEGTARACARGDIQPDGTFRLSTYAKDDGALEGRHRVLVAPPLPDNPRDLGKALVIHPRYEQFETSKLEFTVTRGKNDFTIVVDKP